MERIFVERYTLIDKGDSIKVRAEGFVRKAGKHIPAKFVAELKPRDEVLARYGDLDSIDIEEAIPRFGSKWDVRYINKISSIKKLSQTVVTQQLNYIVALNPSGLETLYVQSVGMSHPPEVEVEGYEQPLDDYEIYVPVTAKIVPQDDCVRDMLSLFPSDCDIYANLAKVLIRYDDWEYRDFKVLKPTEDKPIIYNAPPAAVSSFIEELESKGAGGELYAPVIEELKHI